MAIAKLETPLNFKSLRPTSKFGVRPNEDSAKTELFKRYFIAFEGKETELQYFSGIFNHREEIGVHPNIHIIPLNRTPECKNYSNPQGIMEGCLLKFGFETSENYDNCEVIEYEPEHDIVCIIFDRDEGSFYKHQFDFIKEKSKLHGIKPYLTNPLFEFWLLLHLPDIKQYSVTDLFANSSVSNNFDFIGKQLSNRLGGYNKSKIKFDRFKEGIKLAITQSKTFENNIDDVFSNLELTFVICWKKF